MDNEVDNKPHNDDVKVVQLNNVDFHKYAYKEENIPNHLYKRDLDVSILSEEQKLAYDKYKQGDNIFLTGPGGTGKTKLIQYFIHYSKYYEEKFQVCAMTGCAALLLQCNARTLHSWSGIKLAKGPKDKVVDSVLFNKNAIKNWKKVKILILDEVSMLSKKIFEIIEEIARHAKKNDLPFGGIQVIFSGDFCQLPPVGNYGEKETSQFCFESPIWNKVFPKDNIILLKKIFRQNDNEYANILQHIRQGILKKQEFKLLKKRLDVVFDPNNHYGCIPTKLFPLRAKADHINKLMFEKIEEKHYTFEIVEKLNNITLDNNKPIPREMFEKCKRLSEKNIQQEISNLISNIPCQQTLELKIGANVMCTINLDMDNGICNGSQGVITRIIKENNQYVPYVRFYNGIERRINIHFWQSEDYSTISVGQYPLILAWALTIHKIQGATLDLAEIDVGNSIFEYGQTYVALSRVKSLQGLYLSAFEPEKIQTNPLVIDFYKSISSLEETK